MRRLSLGLAAAIITLGVFQSARAQEPAYESWPRLVNPFESTSGGGVMIDGYRPIVAGSICTTDFSVRLPDGATFQNEIVFEAQSRQGGILCTNGKWRAKQGDANGTTPFEVFIKDGIIRRSPPA